MQFLAVVLASTVLIASTLVSNAWALEIGNGSVEARQDRAIAATRATKPELRVDGDLSCRFLEPGQPCELKLTEKDTGTVYELVGGSTHQVMRLLNDGKRSVTVEGRPGGSGPSRSIAVSRVTAR